MTNTQVVFIIDLALLTRTLTLKLNAFEKTISHIDWYFIKHSYTNIQNYQHVRLQPNCSHLLA